MQYQGKSKNFRRKVILYMILPRSLAACRWKKMVGRRSFPFGMGLIFKVHVRMRWCPKANGLPNSFCRTIVEHGTWKCFLGKWETSTNHQFWVFIVVLGSVNCFVYWLVVQVGVGISEAQNTNKWQAQLAGGCCQWYRLFSARTYRFSQPMIFKDICGMEHDCQVWHH